MTTTSDIVTAARVYIGTPFHHQQRTRGYGVDCVGLVVCAARDAGLTVRDVTDYSRDPDGETLVGMLSAQLDPVRIGWEAGDVMTFWVVRPGLPQHVGIFAHHADREWPTLIHAPVGRKVAEHRLVPQMLEKLHSVWRFRIPAEAGQRG